MSFEEERAALTEDVKWFRQAAAAATDADVLSLINEVSAALEPQATYVDEHAALVRVANFLEIPHFRECDHETY